MEKVFHGSAGSENPEQSEYNILLEIPNNKNFIPGKQTGTKCTKYSCFFVFI